MCLLEKKKKLYRSFFLSEQAHMAVPFSDTIYFLLKIQMSLGKEKRWVLKHRKELTNNRCKNFMLIVPGN